MLKILTDLLGKAEKESRAGNIALMILGDPILSKVYDRIQAKYSYRAATPLKCLVLCENEYVSRVVCESLESSQLRDGLIRVVPQAGISGAFAEYHRLPNQCSGLCSRQKGDLIIVVSVNIPDFTDVVDTICSNRLYMVVSMDRRYDFSYAFSRLQLRCNKMELVQYIPAVERVRQGAVNHDRARRQGFELTSHEFSEYCDRLSRLQSIERGFYSKSRRFAVLGQSPNTAEQPFVDVAGDVPSSLLSKRLCEFMKGGDIIRKRLKRQFEYKDDLIDKKSIEFYHDMIAKIDQLLSV
ncbi:hypothetical protein TELCIR_11281 [Teladorsagia circumcincta]|uniref:Uncharacterized protein n=1 Tax=Teladorsagia circumcincta TaxID=45464 RepID=A0A2G9U9U9_TELCI|nr:hypothetical protein TELCIR_11281 [Teladorsagia circumcincta]